jgi:hypothetical protein
MTDRIQPRRWAWSRLVTVVGLFALGVAASFVDWRRHPPTPGLTGSGTYMRNVPADLSTVLWLYAIEFLVAAAAFQPWLPRPHRSILGLAALLFGLWGTLRWLAGLHSPPVMFPHDLLMLVVALVLGGSTLLYSSGNTAVVAPSRVT